MCVRECGEGFTLENDICVKCKSSLCKICGPKERCLKCNSPYYLYYTYCVKLCPEGYSVDHSTNSCKKCFIAYCQDCQDNRIICNRCIEGFFKHLQKCIPKCTKYYYPDFHARICKRK